MDDKLAKDSLATIVKLRKKIAELEGRSDDRLSGAIGKALDGNRGANLLKRDRDAVAKDRRPNVARDLTDSIRERAGR